MSQPPTLCLPHKFARPTPLWLEPPGGQKRVRVSADLAWTYVFTVHTIGGSILPPGCLHQTGGPEIRGGCAVRIALCTPPAL